jgi:hypothetical protein
MFRKILSNNKRIGDKHALLSGTSPFSICHLSNYKVKEDAYLLMSYQKIFLFHNIVYYVVVFLIFVTASGIHS